MTQFSVCNTPIKDLMVIERMPVNDHRGFLARIFCVEQLKEFGWQKPIAQINLTLTKKRGTVRGMHFQNTPHAEMKLVSCLRGEVWDVAIDLRAKSPTFLMWYAEKLSADNCQALLIPEGFAHGFQALSDDCELLYVHSSLYVQNAEAGIQPTDPRIGISWPLNISEVSVRDLSHPLLNDQFLGIVT
jgi:dTDP-4-dehydrorhamnose 3,5-epimerase